MTEKTIAAARLRLVLDENLGRRTPDRVREIAAMTEPPPPERILSRQVFEETAQRAIGRTRLPMSLMFVEVDGTFTAAVGDVDRRRANASAQRWGDGDHFRGAAW